MRRIMSILSFVTDEDGATAIEYALITALISMAILTAAGQIGGALNSTFNSVASAL
jgi:pilus assembly protein Flp/PilA